jgi:exosortase
MKRKELDGIKPASNITGLFLIVTALSFHLFGILSKVFFISGFSLYFFIFGVVMFMFGIKILKKIFFPLIFLIFMIPMPLIAIKYVSFPLKIWATNSAAVFLKNVFFLPLENHGFNIILPNTSLVIGNPCSGLRSLIALLAMASVFAHYLNVGRLRKTLFVILGLPVALVTNSLRIILLCIAVYLYGSNAPVELLHDISGYAAFIAATIIMSILWRFFSCHTSQKDI